MNIYMPILEDAKKFLKLNKKSHIPQLILVRFLSKKIYPPDPKNRYINIGGGNWYYRRWENVDLHAINSFIDYKTDLRNKEPINLPDGCAKLIFCSHVLEHVSDDVCLFIIKECHRLLNQGGVLRVSVPDMDKAIEAYLANDHDFFIKAEIAGHDSIERKIVHFFASYREGDYTGGPDVLPEEVRQKFQLLDKYEFASWCANLIPKSATYLAHVNGYDFDKLKSFLEKAGFKKIVKSEFRESSVDILRESAFDNRPEISLFVEAFK